MLGTNCGCRQGSEQEDRQDMLSCSQSHICQTGRGVERFSIISSLSCVYIVHAILNISFLFICVCTCLWRSEVNLGVIL